MQICSVSATIGIDWSIFKIFRESGATSLGSKKTVGGGEVYASVRHPSCRL